MLTEVSAELVTTETSLLAADCGHPICTLLGAAGDRELIMRQGKWVMHYWHGGQEAGRGQPAVPSAAGERELALFEYFGILFKRCIFFQISFPMLGITLILS